MKTTKSTTSIRKPREENRFIEDYLRFYLSAEGTDFAVLLTAPWGNGKTHFVRKLIDSFKTQPTLPKGLYISLNGMSTTAEIDRSLFAAIHPLLGSKASRWAGHLFSGMLQTGINLAIPIGNENTKKLTCGLPKTLLGDITKWTHKLDGHFVVFDDLERTLIPLTSLWGYFSDLVTDGHKILLVGSENEMEKKYVESDCGTNQGSTITPCPNGNSSYRRLKEKVVGKTFVLRSEIQDIYGSLVQRNECTTTYDIIIKNKNQLVNILDQFLMQSDKEPHYNYRALKHCFRDYEYWMKQVKSKLRENTPFCNDFFCEFVPLDYAIQTGRLLTDDLRNGAADSQTKACSILGRSHSTPGMEGLDDNHFILPWKILAGLLSNNPLDIDSLNQAINSSSYFLRKETPAWIRLWHLSSLSDDDFKEQVIRFHKDIDESKYLDPEVIIHMFCIQNGLRQMGLISTGETLNEFSEYLEKVKTRIDIDQLDKRQFDLSGLTTGLTYFYEDSDPKTVAEFKTRMKTVLSELKNAKRKNKVQKLVSALDKSPMSFIQFFVLDNGFAPSPVLQSVDPDQFFQKFVSLTPEMMGSVFHVFETRYKADDKERTSRLNPEFNFVYGVLNKIEQWVETHKNDDGSPKLYYMKLFARRAMELKTIVHSIDGTDEETALDK